MHGCSLSIEGPHGRSVALTDDLFLVSEVGDAPLLTDTGAVGLRARRHRRKRFDRRILFDDVPDMRRDAGSWLVQDRRHRQRRPNSHRARARRATRDLLKARFASRLRPVGAEIDFQEMATAGAETSPVDRGWARVKARRTKWFRGLTRCSQPARPQRIGGHAGGGLGAERTAALASRASQAGAQAGGRCGATMQQSACRATRRILAFRSGIICSSSRALRSDGFVRRSASAVSWVGLPDRSAPPAAGVARCRASRRSGGSLS